MNSGVKSSLMSNSCCKPGSYNGFNLENANPFDSRSNPFQSNQWCSNELILKDKELRCRARIQPLDITMKNGLNLAKQDASSKGLWIHH